LFFPILGFPVAFFAPFTFAAGHCIPREIAVNGWGVA
jgi:hypothetical protein